MTTHKVAPKGKSNFLITPIIAVEGKENRPQTVSIAREPPTYSDLPRGYRFMERYEVLKSLEKGSGGTVYLVKDTSSSATPTKTRTTLNEESSEDITEESPLKVLKVYIGLTEFNYFEREYISLSKIA